jgi:hypothetical protein
MCFLLSAVPCFLIFVYFEAILLAQWTHQFQVTRGKVTNRAETLVTDCTYPMLGLFSSRAKLSGFPEYHWAD